MHDAVAAATLLDDRFIRWKTAEADIETADPETSGRVLLTPKEGGGSFRYADSVDLAAYKRIFAGMLYLDYGRKAGQWIPNKLGTNSNLDAIEFFKHLNSVVRGRKDGTMMIAEESTAWPKITAAPEDNGLGFTYKWNMIWSRPKQRFESFTFNGRAVADDDLLRIGLQRFHFVNFGEFFQVSPEEVSRNAPMRMIATSSFAIVQEALEKSSGFDAAALDRIRILE